MEGSCSCFGDGDDSTSENALQICTNLQQVSKAIIQHSFAIYQVDTQTHESLVHAWRSAHTFLSSAQDQIGNCKCTQKSQSSFEDESSQSLKEHIAKYRQIANGNLLGFNQPSESKLLFRAFCSKYANDCGQPWPNETLKYYSMNLAGRLHSLLVQCLGEIQSEFERLTTCTSRLDIRSTSDKERPRDSQSAGIKQIEKVGHVKRQRIIGANQNSENPSSKKLKVSTTGTNLMRERPKTNTIRESPIHEKMTDSKLSCPLDYFFYHNQNDAPSNVNCSEHIDRGLLICINLTDVIGLEVLPSGSNEFVRPEELVEVQKIRDTTKATTQEHEFGNQSTDLVCILSGEQLRHALQYPDLVDCSVSALSPTVHRVASHLSAARLSISYELRGKS
jgi:hypothetical protein